MSDGAKLVHLMIDDVNDAIYKYSIACCGWVKTDRVVVDAHDRSVTCLRCLSASNDGYNVTATWGLDMWAVYTRRTGVLK